MTVRWMWCSYDMVHLVEMGAVYAGRDGVVGQAECGWGDPFDELESHVEGNDDAKVCERCAQVALEAGMQKRPDFVLAGTGNNEIDAAAALARGKATMPHAVPLSEFLPPPDDDDRGDLPF